MTTILDEGRASYNNVEFTVYSSTVRVRPVEDESRRTVAYAEMTFTIRGHIFAADGDDKTVDDAMKRLLQRLTKKGGHFVYNRKGIAQTFEVNAPGGKVRDVKYGPTPGTIDLTPVGDNKAWLVVFPLTVCLPLCDNAVYQFSPLEYVYTIHSTFDHRGYHTRVIAGHLEIPATRNPGGQAARLTDHVDRYRERITPPPASGYRRSQDFQLSADKRRLTFTVTDEQLPTALPAFVVEMPGTYRLKTSMQQGFIQYHGTLNATITPAAGVPRSLTYGIFLQLLHDRLLRLRTLGAVAGPVFPNDTWLGMIANLAMQPARRLCLITDFEVSDEINGYSTSYHVNFMVINSLRVTEVIAGSGMWEPMPGTNYSLFTGSMLESAWRPRGSVGEAYDANSDAVIDLCLDAEALPPLPPTALGGRYAAALAQRVKARNPFATPKPQAQFGAVDAGATGGVSAANSWLQYDVTVEYAEPGGRVALHKPMQTTDPREVLGQNIIAAPQQAGGGRIGGALPNPVPATGGEDIIHDVATPTNLIVVRGRALRLGHPIPLPRLRTVGGRPARLVRDALVRPVQRRYFTTLIHGLEWVSVYYVDAPPDSLPVPTNPLEGIRGHA